MSKKLLAWVVVLSVAIGALGSSPVVAAAVSQSACNDQLCAMALQSGQSVQGATDNPTPLQPATQGLSQQAMNQFPELAEGNPAGGTEAVAAPAVRLSGWLALLVCVLSLGVLGGVIDWFLSGGRTWQWLVSRFKRRSDGVAKVRKS